MVATSQMQLLGIWSVVTMIEEVNLKFHLLLINAIKFK
jgi:hypothetical protein